MRAGGAPGPGLPQRRGTTPPALPFNARGQRRQVPGCLLGCCPGTSTGCLAALIYLAGDPGVAGVHEANHVLNASLLMRGLLELLVGGHLLLKEFAEFGFLLHELGPARLGSLADHLPRRDLSAARPAIGVACSSHLSS